MAEQQAPSAIDDIAFALTECARIQKTLESTIPPYDLAQIPKLDLDGTLPHPRDSGGHMLIGLAAARRLWRLAEVALKQSDAVGTLRTERVHDALQEIIVERFLREIRPLDEASANDAVIAALEVAKAARPNVVHFVPCRLMYAKQPDSFTIGPVTFLTHARFECFMKPRFEAFLRRDDSPRQTQWDSELLAGARQYFSDFTWVAQVEVLGCDEETSRTRAEMAVTAALNIVHLLFGAFHTRRMAIAGPVLDRDRRARFTLKANDELQVWSSTGATSAVGFEDGWDRFLEEANAKLLLRCAAKALEPIADPALRQPVGQRIVDAAAWFGEAVREPAPAAQIVKAVTGLEALIITEERRRITHLFCDRGAALLCYTRRERTFDALAEELREAYGMRSRLAHGAQSPFDPEVANFAPRCLELAAEVICAGLGVFEAHGLLDRPLTNADLAAGFTNLVARIKEEAVKAPAQAVRP